MAKPLPFLCHCLPDFAGIRCELTNSNSSGDNDGCTHRQSCDHDRKLPMKSMSSAVSVNRSVLSDDDSVVDSDDGISAKNDTTRQNGTASTSLPYPSHGRARESHASQSPVTIASSERSVESTKTAVDDENDNDDIAMRWIMLSVGLGVGMAVLMSAILLLAALCWCRCRRRKRSQQASSSMMHNVRNDVTTSVRSRLDAIKSTKINNIIDASKIVAIDVKTPSTALTGNDAMLTPCNVKYVESDNQIPLSHRNIIITRDCLYNYVISNNAKNEASMLTQTGNNGSQREQHHQQLRANSSRIEASCERPISDPCPSPPPSPLLILERLQLPPLQQQQQLLHRPATVYSISSESRRKGAKFLSIRAVDDDEECRSSRRHQSKRVETSQEPCVV